MSRSASLDLQVNMFSQQLFGNQKLSPPIVVTKQMALQMELRRFIQSEQQILQIGMKRTQPELHWVMECDEESSDLGSWKENLSTKTVTQNIIHQNIHASS